MQTPNEYDLSRAFQRIENDLIDSMMRNLKRHRAEEDELGIKWEQWQALQLKELERYRAKNRDKFTGEFSDINQRISDMLTDTYNTAQTEEEARVLDKIRKGDFRPIQTKDTTFFNLNDDKLNILLERTKADFTRAEYAVLRKADDAYRKVIFDAQVYANVTNDYNKAVDMATHDFLKSGLQSIQYKNGARHNIADYARMAIRTTNKRAYLMGEGNARDAYGIHTVRVNKRTQACPLCVGYLGKVLIDDVYGGGTAKEASEKGVPTLSSAMQAGFLHPNCKDIYSTYIEGVSTPATPWTQEEINEIVGDYNKEQAIQHAVDMQASYARMAKYALDSDNQATYQARADQWQTRIDELQDKPPVPVNVATEAVDEVVEQVAKQPKAFTPAKTIEEAEEYAKRFTDASRFGAVGVSYDGVSLDVANIVNKTIGEFYDTFDVDAFGGIIAPKGNTKLGKLVDGATAGYSPIRHSFLLNRKSLKDVKIAEKALKTEREVVQKVLDNPSAYDFSKMSSRVRAVLEASAESGRGTVPMTIEEVLWHELGHTLEKGIAKTPYFANIKANMEIYAPRISGYATTELSEYIAESFCSYMKGEGLVDPELIKAFDALRR